MKFRLTYAAVAVLCLIAPTRLSADEVIDWNNVMLDAIRADSMNGIRSTRVMAMTHTAIYDAVNSIDDAFSVSRQFERSEHDEPRGRRGSGGSRCAVERVSGAAGDAGHCTQQQLERHSHRTRKDRWHRDWQLRGRQHHRPAGERSQRRHDAIHSGHAAGPMAAHAAGTRAGASAKLVDGDAVDYDQRFAIPRSRGAAGAFERRVCRGGQRSESHRSGEQRHAHG